MEFLIERGADPHEKNSDGNTAFTTSLRRGNFVVTDYLFSRDYFCLSDFMPCPEDVSPDIYKAYREKAISRANELIDAKGIVYAKTIAADIEKILKAKEPEPTQEEIDALQPLVKKLTPMDWVGDAQVSSDDFLGYDVTR